jgi:hypothetical protein
MVRTVEVRGDQIQVHANIGPGRILSATLLVDDSPTTLPPPQGAGHDPFGKELDDLLALTDPVETFVDDSREAIYTPDEDLPGNVRQ